MRSGSIALVNAIMENWRKVRNPKCAGEGRGDRPGGEGMRLDYAAGRAGAIEPAGDVCHVRDMLAR